MSKSHARFQLACCLFRLHFSEQYFTCSQSFSHFLRQLKFLPHTAQHFSGRCCFLTPFMSRLPFA
jgi:hypothetical protein